MSSKKYDHAMGSINDIKLAEKFSANVYSKLVVGGKWSSILNNVPTKQKPQIIREYMKVFGIDNVVWDRKTDFVTCTRSA